MIKLYVQLGDDIQRGAIGIAPGWHYTFGVQVTGKVSTNDTTYMFTTKGERHRWSCQPQHRTTFILQLIT